MVLYKESELKPQLSCTSLLNGQEKEVELLLWVTEADTVICFELNGSHDCKFSNCSVLGGCGRSLGRSKHGDRDAFFNLSGLL